MNHYQPMLARTAEESFNDPEWIFEVKWDGVRAIAYIGEEINLKSRNNKELITKFPELRELSKLVSNVVLDGEIVILANGLPDFQTVASRNQASNLKEIH